MEIYCLGRSCAAVPDGAWGCMNIAHCPYSIFVADQDGKVVIGYRNYPDGVMKSVQAMLEGIVQKAVGD